MTQPQKFSYEFQHDVTTTKVFHHRQFALYSMSQVAPITKRFYILLSNASVIVHSMILTSMIIDISC